MFQGKIGNDYNLSEVSVVELVSYREGTVLLGSLVKEKSGEGER